jgi:hypothetical protein
MADVVCVGLLAAVAAGFAVPDTPDAAASIPLASINGYAVEPLLECLERSCPRGGVSTTSPDRDAFGAECVERRVVESRGVAPAVSASSSIAASSAGVRTAADGDT